MSVPSAGGSRPAPRKRPRAAATAAPARSRPSSQVVTVAWSPIEALTVLAVVAAAFMVKDAVLGPIGVNTTSPEVNALARSLVLAVFYAVQIALLVHLARRRGMSPAAAYALWGTGTTARAAAAAAGQVAIWLIATRVAATAYGAIAQAVGFDPPVRWNADLTRVFGQDAVGLALTVTMVVVVGPLVEEAVFRGVILKAISARAGLWAGILGSAAVFAAYHFTAWLLVPTFMLGIALGWIASRNASLWPAVALHGLYNAVAVAAAFYVSGGR